MTKFYVSMIWPDEGPFVYVLDAENQEDAKQKAREMIPIDFPDLFGEETMMNVLDVDCFDIPEFVKNHTKTLSTEELQRLEEDYPVDMWKRAVALDATTLGYTEWIKERKR